MSTTIDQKVVEMRFDNRHFEQHTKETMSTLDKLKQKLNLSGAAKGLDNINSSANKVNMNGLANSVQTVQARFSALEVIGVTALANITNSVVNAGKQMLHSLTIAPVSDGWKEYEMLLNSIQTTMAGTGLTAKEVQKELQKLDEYADKTVYSTADMLNNLPKFTNAGVKLDVATKAMIGIANATAHAGGDAAKASIAFYNLGQAIGTGYLTRMDYNSINGAGIATMEWKNRMVEAAIAAGTLTKVGEDQYKAGNKTLTLQQLFIDGLQEQWATTDVMIKVFGDYGDETTEIGKKAYASAQDIKTFTMMMESLKATAGTGWKDTWEIIFGDLDEAKELWTGITNFISNIITGMADFRNTLLEGALGRTFVNLFEGVNATTDNIKNAVDTIKNYTQVVDDIIGGQWGNGQQRWDALTAAGYDWAHAQNLVNEKLGNSLRRATNYKEVQEEVAEGQIKTTEATADLIVELSKLSDEQLQAKGYTDEQIKSLRELQRVAKQTGIPLKYFVEHINEIDGRWILIDTFKNAMQGFSTVIRSVKDAWVETIGVMTADHLFDFIATLHKLSTFLTVSEETADKLKRTFAGVFAVLDIFFTLTKGPLVLLGRLIISFLQALEILPNDLLGMTAVIGDYLVALRDWVDNVLDLRNAYEFFLPYIQLFTEKVNKFFRTIRDTDAYQKFSEGLTKTKEVVIAWMKGMLEAEDLSQYLIDGLMKGLKTGWKVVIGFITNFAKAIIEGVKDVLDINSPSREFFEIGKNIVLGLFNGISEFVKMVYTLVMSIGGKIIDIVKSLDLGSIFTIAIGSTAVYGFIKIATAISNITAPLGEVEDVVKQFGKTLKAFGGTLKGLKFKYIGEGIKSIAIGVAILAASVYLLATLDYGKLWSAIGAISVLMIVLGALVAVTGIFGKQGLKFGSIALSLVAVSIAISIMATALKKISKIDTGKALQAFLGFAVIIGGLLLLMASIGKNGEKLAGIGSTFMAIAAAFLLLAVSAKMLSKISWEGLAKAGAAVVMLGGLIVGLMAATKWISGSKNVASIGGAIAAIAGALLLMLIVVKIAGRMDPSELKQGLVTIGLFGLFIAGLMSATKLITGSKNVNKIGGAIFGIAAALLMMVIVTKMVAGMNAGDLAKGLLVIAGFGAIIAMLMGATQLISGGKNVSKIGRTLLMMSVAIGLMALTAVLLSMIDLGGLAKGIIAVGLLSVMLMGLIAVTKKAKNITGTLVALTVAIGILSVALGLLSLIKTDKLAGATVAISAVLGMFALLVKSTKNVKKSFASLIVLTVAIAVLATALMLLAKLPVENVVGSAAALSLLMGTLGVLMLMFSKMGGANSKALLGVLGLVALCIPLFMIVEILSMMQNISNAETNAMALAKFMGVLAVVQLLCAAAGAIYTATAGVAMLGLVGMLALVVVLYALLGALAIMANIPDAITNLTALQSFLIVMTQVLVVLSIVGPLALIGVTAMAGLIGLMTIIGVLAVAIGYLMEKLPSLEGFLDKGLPTLVKLAGGIGAMIGAFIGGALAQISGSLPTIGKNLSEFMINALPFITIASTISPRMMDGVKALAEAFLILTGANLLDKLTSWLTGGNSLAGFGEQLGQLGTDLSTFVSSLGTFSDDQVTTVDCAARAIKALAEAASVIPNEGGLWGSIVGENSLATFGSNLPGLATNLAQFVSNLGSFTSDQVSSVDYAGQAIKLLAESAKDIPNDGGLWGAICGENSLATFGSYLPDLGTNLAQFVGNLGTFTEDQVTTVDCVGKAIKTLAAAAQDIPNDGGLWGAICGENSLATFGSYLPDLGTNLAQFVGNLGTFSNQQVSTVYSASDAIRAIADLGEINIKSTSKSLSTLGDKLVDFAKDLKSFVDEVAKSGKDSVDSAIAKVKDLIDMATQIAGVNVKSLTKFGDSLADVAKEGVKDFVEAFSGKTPKKDAEEAAGKLLDSVITGAEDKKKDVKSKFEDISEAAVDSLYTKSIETEAKQAGKDLVTGFANGIKNNKYLAANAGTEIGKAALEAAKEAIDSHSPSREAMKIGNYFGEGLVIGINDYENKTYKAGYSIAEYAKNGLSKAIAKVSSLLSSDMDTQPTIRPVLDLSEVESGASYLNSMFNNGPSVGVSANLNSISSGMQRRLQNGANDDVISAINKLRGDLSNVPRGDTYNINGITYDDGSNVSNAVRDLIRAAKVERRV